MTKKDLYLSPQADVLDLSYADPVCQATSNTGEVPNFLIDTYTPDWII